MTLIDSINRFEKKTGEKFFWRGDYNLSFDETDGSFCQWKVFHGVIFIAETCGNALKWWHFVEEIAKLNRIGFVITFTRRNHKAFRRLTKSNILYNFKDDDGTLVYCFFKEVG